MMRKIASQDGVARQCSRRERQDGVTGQRGVARRDGRAK